VQRERLEDGSQLVKTIRPHTEYAEVQVDLGVGPDGNGNGNGSQNFEVES
jgi:hypothetical protein